MSLAAAGSCQVLFTENDTNAEKLFRVANRSKYVKDGIHDCVIQGSSEAVNPGRFGTKVALHYLKQLGPASHGWFP
jgi:hypothetical protein